MDLDTLGLILDICGASVLFKFGFPQPGFDETPGLALEDNTILEDGTRVADLVSAEKRKKHIYKVMSSFGLTLLIVGFVLQLIHGITN